MRVTEGAKNFIAEEAYDPVYGARPVKRYIQKHLETELGRLIIRGAAPEGSVITVDEAGDRLGVRWKKNSHKDQAKDEKRRGSNKPPRRFLLINGYFSCFLTRRDTPISAAIFLHCSNPREAANRRLSVLLEEHNAVHFLAKSSKPSKAASPCSGLHARRNL
jgi:hypothetical protein